MPLELSNQKTATGLDLHSGFAGHPFEGECRTSSASAVVGRRIAGCSSLATSPGLPYRSSLAWSVAFGAMREDETDRTDFVAPDFVDNSLASDKVGEVPINQLLTPVDTAQRILKLAQ